MASILDKSRAEVFLASCMHGQEWTGDHLQMMHPLPASFAL